jgi:hypothetical protein
MPLPSHTPFSYSNPSQDILEMDSFNKIALSLRTVARPASEDEYKDYNSQDSYNPRKRGALI